MKRRLNILCVIVLLVLGYSVLETTYYVGLGIKTGIEKGLDSKIDACLLYTSDAADERLVMCKSCSWYQKIWAEIS